MEQAIQTEIQKMTDVGTQTDRLPTGAVIIQKAEKAKKKSSMKKRQIKDIPNAIPNQAQRFRIFKEIDYPYLMRNVETQNEEDKMIRALREVFGIKEKTPEVVAEEALEKSVIKGRSYPTFTEEEMTQQEKRIRSLNSDSSLKKKASVKGLFDDTDAEAESYFLPPELRKVSEDYRKYLRAYDSKYLEGSTPLSEIPFPNVNVESIEDRVASFGSLPLSYTDYSGKGRPSKQSEKFKQGKSLSRQETLFLGGGVAKKDPIQKALEDYELTEGIAKGGLTQAELQKQKEKIAGSILTRWAKVGLAKESLFNRMVESSIQQDAFKYNLEKMKKERQKQDKEIERSFGLYDASQRARKEGEMASLLFDY